MTWIEPIIARLDIYGPLGLFLAFALIVIAVLGYVIIHLDTERTKSAKDRAAGWDAERESYQTRFFAEIGNIAAIMQKHEERSNGRHEAIIATQKEIAERQHETALILREVSTMLQERR